MFIKRYSRNCRCTWQNCAEAETGLSISNANQNKVLQLPRSCWKRSWAMATQQSSSPASVQGRWTFSLHHPALPEPAGHGGQWHDPDRSERPIWEPCTGLTKPHWEPGKQRDNVFFRFKFTDFQNVLHRQLVLHAATWYCSHHSWDSKLFHQQ